MSIPVQNLYYLLCYAWDQWESGQLVDVESLDTTEQADLFAKVLIEGTSHLFRRGLDRNYRSESQELAGIRGQIDFTGSLTKMLFQQGRARCRVDELTHDVLHNQILKSTLRRLSGLDGLDGQIRREVGQLLRKFRGVSEVPKLTPRLFSQVQLHRNNRFYRFLLDICELIVRNLLVNEHTGETRFRDILRDKTRMSTVFERFVFNFYRREHDGFRASSRRLSWQASAPVDEHLEWLPGMNTDVTLESPDRVIIIDTKYYQKTLQTGRWGGERVHSENLYQLYAYLRSFDRAEKGDGGRGKPIIEGMLLYPVVEQEVRLDYEIDGYRVQICTVDLAQSWREIEEELMGIVEARHTSGGRRKVHQKSVG